MSSAGFWGFQNSVSNYFLEQQIKKLSCRKSICLWLLGEWTMAGGDSRVSRWYLWKKSLQGSSFGWNKKEIWKMWMKKIFFWYNWGIPSCCKIPVIFMINAFCLLNLSSEFLHFPAIFSLAKKQKLQSFCFLDVCILLGDANACQKLCSGTVP